MIKTIIPSSRQPALKLAKLAAAVAVATTAMSAQAITFEPNDDLTIDWNTTLTYGLSWRVEDRDSALIDPTQINADDGNNNFDKGDLIANRASFLTEADFNYKGDYGFFVRASGFYDNVYHDKTATGGDFHEDVVDQHGDDIRLLDAYVYGSFDVAGNPLTIRLGDQVVSWGESMFVPNGISSAQSPVDATKANIPGMEIKDLFLPVSQLYVQYPFNDVFAVQAYTQFDWDNYEIDGVGSYFSYTDLMDKGGSMLLTPDGVFSRTTDATPEDSGQWGVAFTYLAEQLNDTEFGLYYLRFHDRAPMLDAISLGGLGQYQVQYFDDIKLVGLSVSSVIGNTNVSGEVSYRDGQPVLVNVPMYSPALDMTLDTPYAVRAETVQAQVSAIHVFGTNPISDNATLVGEIGYNRVLDHEAASIELAPLFVVEGDELTNDKSSWGYTAQLTLDYFNVAPGLDLAIPITYSQAVDGVSSIIGSFNQGEGDDRFSIGLNFTYLNNLRAEVSYTSFLGNADETALSDRDYMSINVKYSF